MAKARYEEFDGLNYDYHEGYEEWMMENLSIPSLGVLKLYELRFGEFEGEDGSTPHTVQDTESGEIGMHYILGNREWFIPLTATENEVKEFTKAIKAH